MPLFGTLFASSAPGDLGLVDGALRPPPSTPNCVHSQVPPDTMAHIEPLAGDFATVVDAVAAHDEVAIRERRDDWVHAEATTPVMGFVDDIELTPGDGVVHVRSASRVGGSDMGKNRKRIEEVRATL